jgi:hypothetical protein
VYAWLDWILGHGRRFGGELPAGGDRKCDRGSAGGIPEVLKVNWCNIEVVVGFKTVVTVMPMIICRLMKMSS